MGNPNPGPKEEKPNYEVMSNVSNVERNFSLSRPSIIKDNLTEDDYCTGWLEKQQPKMLRRWQKRFFVLDKKLIKYYKNKDDYMDKKQPKGVLNLKQIWINPTFNQSGFKIDLQLMGSNRVFNLRCANMEEFSKWRKKLTHAINTSLGKLKEIKLDAYKEDIST